MNTKESIKIAKKYLKFYGFYTPFYIRMFGSRDTPAIGEHWQERDSQLKEVDCILDKMYPEYRHILVEGHLNMLSFADQVSKYGYAHSQLSNYIKSAYIDFTDKADIKKPDKPVQKPSKRLINAINRQCIGFNYVNLLRFLSSIMPTNLGIIVFVGNHLTTFMQPCTLTNTDIKKPCIIDTQHLAGQKMSYVLTTLLTTFVFKSDGVWWGSFFRK